MDLINEVTDGCLLSQSNGNPWEVNLYVPRDDVVDSAVRMIEDLREAIPSLRFDGLAQEVVTVHDTAFRVGVSETLVHTWSTHPQFPIGRWTWVRVMDWLREYRPGLLDEYETELTWDQVVEIELALAGVKAA